MQHLLAASLIFLIFGFGTATSLGTAKAGYVEFRYEWHGLSRRHRATAIGAAHLCSSLKPSMESEARLTPCLLR